MVTPSAGSVVLVTFPFSHLSATKLRPAVVLADAGRGDWVLCQITSNPYADPNAVELTNSHFARGSLQRLSFARPGRLFTANASLMRAEVGRLSPASLKKIRAAVLTLFEPGCGAAS